MRDIKVVFFDMGNTLLHFHHGETDEEKDKKGLIYLTEYLKKFDERISLDEVENNFFNNWMDSIEDRKRTYKEYPIEEFLNKFMKRFNVELQLSECIEAINIFYTEYRRQVSFENDLYGTLKAIKDKGYKIGVKSNTCYYDEVMEECFKKAGIYELIDSFTFSYSLSYGKPHRKIFDEAINKMMILPEEAIMVGDNLNSDIKPAKELGMIGVWLNNSNKTLESSKIADFTISKLTELLQIINVEDNYS